MQKMSKNCQSSKKNFFAWNNLKRLKIRSQHHLCSPRQISGRYFSKKGVGHFSRNLWPRICKKSKKIANFQKKIFFARNNLKRFKIRSQQHLCSPRQISGRYLSKKKLVIFQEIYDPGYAKKVKKLATFEKKIFAQNDLKRLEILSQHHLWSPRKISGPYLSKKKLVIFQEICDPGYEKKSKNFQFLKNFFFLSKQP